METPKKDLDYLKGPFRTGPTEIQDLEFQGSGLRLSKSGLSKFRMAFRNYDVSVYVSHAGL